jgi:hypothetical protein
MDRFLTFLFKMGSDIEKIRIWHSTSRVYKISKRHLAKLEVTGWIELSHVTEGQNTGTYAKLIKEVPQEIIDANMPAVDECQKRIGKLVGERRKAKAKTTEEMLFAGPLSDMMIRLDPRMWSTDIHPITGRIYTRFTQCAKVDRPSEFPALAGWVEYDAIASHLVLLANYLERIEPDNSWTAFVYQTVGSGKDLYRALTPHINFAEYRKNKPANEFIADIEFEKNFSKDDMKPIVYSIVYGGNFKFLKGFADVKRLVSDLISQDNAEVRQLYDKVDKPYRPKKNLSCILSRLEADLMFEIWGRICATGIDFMPCHDALFADPQNEKAILAIADQVIQARGIKHFRLRNKGAKKPLGI